MKTLFVQYCFIFSLPPSEMSSLSQCDLQPQALVWIIHGMLAFVTVALSLVGSECSLSGGTRKRQDESSLVHFYKDPPIIV